MSRRRWRWAGVAAIMAVAVLAVGGVWWAWSEDREEHAREGVEPERGGDAGVGREESAGRVEREGRGHAAQGESAGGRPSVAVERAVDAAVSAAVEASGGRGPAVGFDAAAARLDEAALGRAVEVLASDAMEGRATGSEGIAKARRWLVGALTDAKVKRLGGAYVFPWEVVEEGLSGANVVAVHPGLDPALRDEVVVLGAHYDHIGLKADAAPGEDRVYNGADDNASGTALVLEVAKALRASRAPLRRTVVFVWFSGEELGLWGSSAYVEAPPLPWSRHVAMVNVDMVGRNPERPVKVYGVGTWRGWRAVVREAGGLVPDVAHRVIPSQGPLLRRSDHHSFWVEGLPVLVLHTGVHRDYHEVSDHAERIDRAHLKRMARLAMALVWARAGAYEAATRGP